MSRFTLKSAANFAFRSIPNEMATLSNLELIRKFANIDKDDHLDALSSSVEEYFLPESICQSF